MEIRQGTFNDSANDNGNIGGKTMVANNYEYIEDEQELYTLSEAKRELKRRNGNYPSTKTKYLHTR